MPTKSVRWLIFLLTFGTVDFASQTAALLAQAVKSPTRSYNFVQYNRELSIVAVGDVMLGSWVTPVLAEHGSSYPFEKTSVYLRNANLAIANLEAPFTRDGEPFEKKFNFKVPPKHAVGLRAAGFDVVTLANNHIMDYGETGLNSTIETLDRIGVKYCGAGPDLNRAHSPAVLETQGRRVAFFGYSMTFPKEFYAKDDSAGTAYPEPELMTASLKAWQDSVDFIVVSFHWGAEKSETPKDYQVFFAHLAIDSGADLVLGHHPHVLQGLEIYKNRLIAYSLGNFAFGSYSRFATDSIILKVYLTDNGLFYARCLPINVDNREVEFQPDVLPGAQGQAVISRLMALSLPLNNHRDILDHSGLVLGDWQIFHHEWLFDQVLNAYWPALSQRELLDIAKVDTTGEDGTNSPDSAN